MKFDINSIKVAKPCPEIWENMAGDERVRRCAACRLDVHNLSAMDTAEIEALLKSPNGRVCIRLYRRADGTVTTTECPKGLQAYRRTVAKFATVFASILSLASISVGQREESPRRTAQGSPFSFRQDREADVKGTITDSAGAVIPGAKISVYRQNKHKPIAEVGSDGYGNYIFPVQKAGFYRLEVRIPGFKTAIVENVLIAARSSKMINVSLEPSDETVVVGIYLEEPRVDVRSSSVTQTISAEQVQRIPF